MTHLTSRQAGNYWTTRYITEFLVNALLHGLSYKYGACDERRYRLRHCDILTHYNWQHLTTVMINSKEQSLSAYASSTSGNCRSLCTTFPMLLISESEEFVAPAPPPSWWTTLVGCYHKFNIQHFNIKLRSLFLSVLPYLNAHSFSPFLYRTTYPLLYKRRNFVWTQGELHTSINL